VDRNKSSSVLVLTTAILLAGALITRQHRGSADLCGRDLSTQLHFASSEVASEGVPIADDTSVVAVSKFGKGHILYIYLPSRVNTDRSGYFSSEDEGKTWKTEEKPPALSMFVSGPGLMQAPSDSRVLYKYRADSGIYLRSDNGGRSWHRPAYKLDQESVAEFKPWLDTAHSLDFTVIAIHPEAPRSLFATVRLLPARGLLSDSSVYAPDRLYQSTDGGESWTRYGEGTLNASPVAISAHNPAQMYGIGPKGQIIQSLDGGLNWNVINDTVPSFLSGVKIKNWRSGIIGTVRQFFVDDNRLILVTSAGVLQSVNKGKDWRLLDLGFDEIDSVNSAAISEHRLYVGTVQGLFVSANGGCTFKKISSPPGQ
jgi:photosystem II stability/assembly factor-like uncharacterized protein